MYGFSERPAQRLMAAARRKEQIRHVSDLDRTADALGAAEHLGGTRSGNCNRG
jgi:hypothetical protein